MHKGANKTKTVTHSWKDRMCFSSKLNQLDQNCTFFAYFGIFRSELFFLFMSLTHFGVVERVSLVPFDGSHFSCIFWYSLDPRGPQNDANTIEIWFQVS